MKRKLLTQMAHEWRSNVWLILELTIVSVLLAYFFLFFTKHALDSTYDFGYDTTDMFTAEIKLIPEDSEFYQPYDSAHSAQTDLDMLRRRISQMPCVEHVGLGSNALPYNYNFSSITLEFTEADSTYRFYGNHRAMSPEVALAMRLRGLHGETPRQIAQMLRQGKWLVSDIGATWGGPEPVPDDFVGRSVIVDGDSSTVEHIGGAVHGIHRSDYEVISGGVIIQPILPGQWANDLIVRVKPGMASSFIEQMNSKAMEQGNVYLSNLSRLEFLRDVAHVDNKASIRTVLVCGIFLMTMIFLGFLGTFWFRTQQRSGEIAIRMVCGATSAQIFRRLIGEGLILLTVASLISLLIEWTILKYINVATILIDGTLLSPWWGAAGCYVALAIVVVSGICIPARKAMLTSPAEVL